MEKEKLQLAPEERREETAPSSKADKKSWQEPKLAFVMPKLTKHGDLEKVTSGFFCTFGPFDETE